VKCADGQTYSTFDVQIAQGARFLIGQMAQLEFEIKQQGKYTNYTLEAVRASSDALHTAGGGHVSPSNGFAHPQTPTATPQSVSVAPVAAQVVSQDDREQRIIRQSSFKAGFDFASAYAANGLEPDEAIALGQQVTEMLIQFAHNGQWPVRVSEPVAVS